MVYFYVLSHTVTTLFTAFNVTVVNNFVRGLVEVH